jgi:MFS family permease
VPEVDEIVRARRRLLSGVALAMCGNGLLLMLFSVRSTEAGFGSTVTAVVVSGYYLGFLVGSQVAAGLVRKTSTGVAFGLLSLLVAITSFVAPLWVSAPFWIVLRSIIGFCFASIYVVVESWLNRSTPNADRARVLGIYLASMMASFASGSLIVLATDTNGVTAFVVAGALLVVGAALTSRLPEPSAAATALLQRLTMRQLIRRAPLGTSSAVVISIANAAFVSSLAVWATRSGYSSARTSVFVTLGSLGPVFVQGPVTRWSDRTSRPRVMLTMTLISAAVAIGGAFGPGGGLLPLIGVFVLGGLSFTQYSLYGAETNDHLTAEQMPSAGGHLMLLTGIGAIVGSVTVGVVYRLVGNDAVFWTMAVAHLGVALLVIASGRLSLPGLRQTPSSSIP